VVELVGEFGVSYPTMVFRLHNCGLLYGGAGHRDELMHAQSAVLTYELRKRRLDRRTILPPDYVQFAIDAYTRQDISLDRLAEYLFDEEEAIREALRDGGLLRPENE
jgi:hypothetical protein